MTEQITSETIARAGLLAGCDGLPGVQVYADGVVRWQGKAINDLVPELTPDAVVAWLATNPVGALPWRYRA